MIDEEERGIEAHKKVCEEENAHIWNDDCEDAHGRLPYCYSCGAERPPLTEDEIHDRITIVPDAVPAWQRSESYEG